MLRALAVLVLVALVAAAGVYVAAGRTAPPSLAIEKPDRTVGQRGAVEITVSPRQGLATLTVTLEQGGRSIPLFALDTPQAATVTPVDPDAVHISRPFGKQGVPDLQSGSARIVVSATRRSFWNLRTVSATASKEVQVRLEPPRIALLSTHHYVNHGGAEMVVYRTTPAEVSSGVRVGDLEYPGYLASGAGATGSDAGVKVAFFALQHDQNLNTPIAAFARDDAGNEAKVSFVDNTFEKRFRKSRIEVDDRFFGRVVPEILEHSPELKMQPPGEGDLLPAFLKINGELRRMNAEQIAKTTSQTAPSRLWSGPFVQLGNSQVEASFADYRTYVYKGRDVDQQVHLGFDLAVVANSPVHAANNGKVLNASWLGIYGNCIIIDHGMGVASLYGHLSSFDVNVGDTVAKGQTIGRTGTTGLAGGDHLHFTMLVNGRAVNPVEWWDPHWIQDRVERKLQELGTPASSGAAVETARPSTTAQPRRGRARRGNRP